MVRFNIFELNQAITYDSKNFGGTFCLFPKFMEILIRKQNPCCFLEQMDETIQRNGNCHNHRP